MKRVIVDLVSEDDIKTVPNPVVAEVSVANMVSNVVPNIVVDVLDTSDQESVLSDEDNSNGDTEFKGADDSNIEMDSEFFGIKPEDRHNSKRMVEEPRNMNTNEYGKTSANEYVRKQKKSKLFLKQILFELDDFEALAEELGEDYDGDVDVGTLDDEDYNIGPVIQQS